MILGCLLLAVIAGLLSSSLALFCGYSFLFAFGLYTAAGTITLIVLLLTAMLIGTLSPDQERITHPRTLRTGRRTLKLGEGSIDRV